MSLLLIIIVINSGWKSKAIVLEHISAKCTVLTNEQMVTPV